MMTFVIIACLTLAVLLPSILDTLTTIPSEKCTSDSTKTDLVALGTISGLLLLNSQKSKKIPTPEEIQKRESEKDSTIKKEIEICKNFIGSLIEKEFTTQKFKVEIRRHSLQGVAVSFDLLKKHIDKLIIIFNDAGWGLILDDTYLHIYPHFKDSEKKIYR